MRSNITRMAVVLAAMCTAIAPVAMAAEDEAVSSDPWSRHPLVGDWSVDTAPGDDMGPTDAAVFRSDGTMIEAGPAGRGAGFWIPTGERSASAVFNVPWTTELSFDGFVTVRTHIVVGDGGDSFAGTYTLEGPPAAGLSAAATVAESVVGVRILETSDPAWPAVDG